MSRAERNVAEGLPDLVEPLDEVGPVELRDVLLEQVPLAALPVIPEDGLDLGPELPVSQESVVRAGGDALSRVRVQQLGRELLVRLHVRAVDPVVQVRHEGADRAISSSVQAFSGGGGILRSFSGEAMRERTPPGFSGSKKEPSRSRLKLASAPSAAKWSCEGLFWLWQATQPPPRALHQGPDSR